MRGSLRFPVLSTVVPAMLLCAGMVAIAAAEKVTVVGTVSTTLDDDWEVTDARLTTDDGVVYHITLDAKGKALADAMDEEKAEVTGTLSKKGDANWLTVLSYKKVKEPADDED